MAVIEYIVDGHVAVVTLNSGENHFNPSFLQSFLSVLDEVESKTEATTIVVTSSHEKIFSNGIDLEWLVPVIQKGDVLGAKAFFYLLNQLFNAGGAILCCAFDFRFMRSDRGFFCFPEVDLGIPFLPGMNALLKKAIPMYKLEEMEYTGNRLTAAACEQHHIITQACTIQDLMPQTLSFAKSVNKKRAVVQEMKLRLNKDIVHAIDVEDVPFIESGKFNIG
ncbi:MAG: enoyl-CoA hydratase/isomerase family protein [Deltaproteobacteria bacterium]|nr:enoyl-CoA hydratase/isomerase family protein [Deltaproteobacteria bacterium]